MARVLNLEQYARETSGTTDADVQGHIHAGLRSKPTTKTYARWYDRKLRELQDARDATRTAYRAALASGELVAPERPSLDVVAAGEGSAAEAARRILAKRAARK